MTANYIQDTPFNQELRARRRPPKSPERAGIDAGFGPAWDLHRGLL